MPATAHADTGKHGTLATPPAQNEPTAHAAHAVALAPDDVPGAQGIAAAAPPAQVKPAGQGVLAFAADVEPAGQYAPGGDAQGVQSEAATPEKEPAEHILGRTKVRPGQAYPASQSATLPAESLKK